MPSAHVCPGCGLDYGAISPADAKVAIRSYPRRFRSALAASMEDQAEEGLIRRRPDSKTWSALEYTAHVADRYDLLSEVVGRMFEEESPAITWWDSDERALAERYEKQDPQAALNHLERASTALAAAVDRVDSDSWARTASFPFGDRDLRTMVGIAVHEGSHHLRDVERVLGLARGR